MPKQAIAAVEEPNTKVSFGVSVEVMALRKSLARRIRARMAQPATAVEEKLWRELKTEVEKERLTFRS